jgi:hypothetical protein
VLRSRVAAGEKPRVVVRTPSASVAAGTRGNVVRLGDPKDNEYVVVRLGRDEVPFAPSELALSVRGKTAAAATTAAPASPAAAPAPARTASAKAASPRATATKTAGHKPATATKRPAAAAPSRSRRSSTAARRSAAPLTVTLRFRNDEWTVEAQRGARRLSKPGPLRPGAVSAFAEHVDDEAIRDALVETVESCRSVVEQRAEALRAQLHEAEAALKDYEAKPSRRTVR